MVPVLQGHITSLTLTLQSFYILQLRQIRIKTKQNKKLTIVYEPPFKFAFVTYLMARVSPTGSDNRWTYGRTVASQTKEEYTYTTASSIGAAKVVFRGRPLIIWERGVVIIAKKI